MNLPHALDRLRAAAMALGSLLVLLAGGVPLALANDLAVANGDWLRVVNAETGARVRDVNRYSQVMRLDYRPDGQRLAVGVCFGNKIVELETTGYGEVGVPITASGCPWDTSYAPGTRSLAATVPVRPNPLGAMTGHLRIAGLHPLDRQVGYPLGALAWRPDGAHLAMVTPQGVDILGPGPAYAVQVSWPGVAYALAYTTDGARLIVGTPGGFDVLDATNGYTLLSSAGGGAVRHIAVAPSGTWLALMRSGTVSVRRSIDLVEVASLAPPGATLRAAEFSRDGTLLAVAETRDRVHRYRVPDWAGLGPLTTPGRVDAIAFRPAPTQVVARIPVLFVHGYSLGSAGTWIDPGPLTSFAEALAANPQLPLDAFHLELPLRGSAFPQNFTRSIADDATDILAAIEGGLDSAGRTQVGILNMPAYRKVDRVALVGYSMGTLSSRYYLKNLMGSRRNGAFTVSEFVALAPANHGIAGIFAFCDTPGELDKSLRQLCGGYLATWVSALAPCPCIPPLTGEFTTNSGDDATFLIDLNGHPLTDSCSANSYPSEAPSSRPTTPGGVLYAAFYAVDEDDVFIGGEDQGGDCLGRRLARNMADDAENREIANIPVPIHDNTPHFWDTICLTLRTIVDRAVPVDQFVACQGLTQP
jgi:hypothetical protein